MSAELAAVYGENMSFHLVLGDEDEFEFILAGNTAPLFNQLEMGRWHGNDAEGVARLRGEIGACTDANNPPEAPDSAYVHVAYDDGERREHLYALYAPPNNWAQVQTNVLAQVHGAWLDQRVHTLAVTGNWVRPKVTTKDRPMASIDFDSSGSQNVSFSTPTREELWRVTLVPQGLTPEELDVYPYELDPDEFLLVSPVASADSEQVLDPGRKLGVMLTIKRKLAVGRYDVTASYLSQQVRGNRVHAFGRITLNFVTLEVTS